ncbi:MAG: glycoside hydrolase family 88 protein [Chitinophagaceae bacterium]
MTKKFSYLVLCVLGVVAFSFTRPARSLNVKKQLTYTDRQVKRTLAKLGDTCLMPRSMNADQTSWHKVNKHDWTSGFWPGILWYDYEYTKDEKIRQQAVRFTDCLESLSDPKTGGDHDLGFQLFCSYGNAYRLTGDERYKKIIISGADKLAKLYNPKVGTILSWPVMVKKMGWPHNTIIDNMMNIEMLFWASKNGGDKKLYEIALAHAKKTMQYQFRPDGSSYHVAVYDTADGRFIKGVTNQGYGDHTMWARGQAWGIYGFTMSYRETKDTSFLRFAEKISDIFLLRLPSDKIPYWDFDAPKIPAEPRDASAAAIAASALLELSTLEDKPVLRQKYWAAATGLLESLSSDAYQAGKDKPAFLKHCTGNLPSGYEIDASINYGDYYYIEALTRYKKYKKPANEN